MSVFGSIGVLPSGVTEWLKRQLEARLNILRLWSHWSTHDEDWLLKSDHLLLFLTSFLSPPLDTPKNKTQHRMSGGNHHPQMTLPGYGTIQGITDYRHPVTRFLNIPFGTITERWRPAVRPQPWTGVRDASKQG